MSKTPDPVHLKSNGASAAAQPRAAQAEVQALEAARRRSAAASAEAERRAFADTEPAFLDTITPAHHEE